jgi:hypothetical protein
VCCWHCRACNVKTCAQAKGVAFCAECSAFPCDELSALSAKSLVSPTQVIVDGQAIKDKGWPAWSAAKAKDYACPSCGGINSAFDLTCRKCSHDPSSDFVVRHKEAITRLLKGRK